MAEAVLIIRSQQAIPPSTHLVSSEDGHAPRRSHRELGLHAQHDYFLPIRATRKLRIGFIDIILNEDTGTQGYANRCSIPTRHQPEADTR